MNATPSPWALDRLRLRIDDLVLRPVVETDLDDLGDLMPLDLEVDPSLSMPFGLDPKAARSVAARQAYWRAQANWSPDSWNLSFAVTRGGDLLGVQTLEARDFAILRTVETASWLGSEHRGQGIGKAMRTAVLALAFDGLAAEVAETEAWADNAASIGVSRALGYEPNGTTRHLRIGATITGEPTRASDDMPKLRLDLAGWRARARPHVTIEALDGCRAWFIAP